MRGGSSDVSVRQAEPIGELPAENRPSVRCSPAGSLQTGAVRSLHLAAGEAAGGDLQGLSRIADREGGRIAGGAAGTVADHDGKLRSVIESGSAPCRERR